MRKAKKRPRHAWDYSGGYRVGFCGQCRRCGLRTRIYWPHDLGHGVHEISTDNGLTWQKEPRPLPPCVATEGRTA